MKSLGLLENCSLQRQINNNLPLKEIYFEITKVLNGNDVSVEQYALGIPDCDEHYCLHVEEGLWNVYYSERGVRSSLCLFSNVNDAVNFFVWSLISDKLPKINWASINLFSQ